MDIFNDETVIRPARHYFVESVMYTRGVFSEQNDPPHWLPVSDKLTLLNEFYRKTVKRI